MLSRYEGAIGVKTGFTKRTGRSLVSAAKRDGMTLICVTLDAPDDWRDHTAMLDYGFDNFCRRTVAGVGEYTFEYNITGADTDTVTLVNTHPLILTLPRSAAKLSFTHFSTSRFAFAPVTRGDILATVSVSACGQTASSPLVARETIAKAYEKDSFWRKFFNFFKKD
jgi:D-alanyl-D-alanine carboxypeptidase/D-alanyl-D-alanine carboxypeptidase (penicillin-binding protein 5/6)